MTTNILPATRDIRDSALMFAQSGFPVLPLAGKLPRTAHGYKDAVTDFDTITDWFYRWPESNFGFVLPEHVICFDVDPRNLPESDQGKTARHVIQERLGGELPDTFTQLSGRGDGGSHFLFSYRLPAGFRFAARKLGQGVDFRGPQVGYIVGAPSIHPDSGRPYTHNDMPVTALPTQLAHAFTERLPVPSTTPVTVTGPKNPAGLLRVFTEATEGQRNERLWWAASKGANENQGDEFFTELARLAGERGLSATEITNTIKSARRSRK